MKNTLLITFVSFLICPSINAQEEKPKQKETKIEDPVCHMKVKKSVKITAKHKDIEYSFCSDSCKESFVKNPDKYIKNK